MKKALEMITVEVDSEIKLSGPVSSDVYTKLESRLIIDNPVYLERVKRGYWTGNTPKTLSYIQKNNTSSNCDGTITMPRGFLYQLRDILLESRCFFVIDSNPLRTLEEVDIQFNHGSELRESQQRCVDAILDKGRDFSVASMPTGAGKMLVLVCCMYRIIIDSRPIKS